MDDLKYTISAKARTQLWDALDGYFQVLESSQLADSSVRDYYWFAECFVRWLDGTFIPGAGRNQP